PISRPIQAAFTSAATFAAGAALPLFTASLATPSAMAWAIAATALAALALLGAIGARAGGAKITTAVFRVTIWGALAMAATALIGRLAGAIV
ncbi:MAG: VIT1/CCC1 transporter family protein, partial [Hyphomonadaceae bacterium]